MFAGLLVLGGSLCHAQTLTANPNPILVNDGSGAGITTLSWSAPGISVVDIRIGSPSGSLFAEGGPTGSATTAKWVTNGMLFYLIDKVTGEVLTTFTATVQTGSAAIAASPTPVMVTDGSGHGLTTIYWNAPGVASINVHVGSPSGSLFAVGGSEGFATTGQWVTDGMLFYLVNASSGSVLASYAVPVQASAISCSAMSPLTFPTYNRTTDVSSLYTLSVSVSSNVTSVDFLLQNETQSLAQAQAIAGTNTGNGNWSFTFSPNPSYALGAYKISARLHAGATTQMCGFASFTEVIQNTPNDLGPAACTGLAGSWQDTTIAGASYNLTESSNYTITGTATVSNVCGVAVNWTVAGSLDPANGNFSLTATSPTAPGPGCVVAQTVITQGTVASPVCNTSPVSTITSYYADGSQAGPDAVNLASAVAIPPGESSTALGIWDTADGNTTQAEFQGNLFNAAQGEQFRGRVVNETSPFGGTDGCHSPGDPVAELTQITGGRWWVQNNNSYKTDYIGLSPSSAAYYQYYRAKKGLALPCIITVPQQMQINTSGTSSFLPYGSTNQGNTNSLQLTIDGTSVKSSRAGQSSSKAFRFQQ